jgi:DNA-binding XRE family transcriptional regulator
MTTSTMGSAHVAWQHGAPSDVRSRPNYLLVYEGSVSQPERIAGAITLDAYLDATASQPGWAEALARARQTQADEPGASSPLARLRLRAGLSQQQLAIRMGSSQPHIARCEQGKHDPGTSTIARLAEALGLPASEVFEAAQASLHRRVKP